jgi:N-acetylneuraminic acid mutarotase
MHGVYRDLWRLDLATWEWEELKIKGGPSARSGHRMLCHKGKLWLFGGYYDAGDSLPKYYCDLWVFDPAELQWSTVGDMKAKWPKARSGYQWVAHEGTLVMHGGYAKTVDEDEPDMEHGVAMDDTWWAVSCCMHAC